MVSGLTFAQTCGTGQGVVYRCLNADSAGNTTAETNAVRAPNICPSVGGAYSYASPDQIYFAALAAVQAAAIPPRWVNGAGSASGTGLTLFQNGTTPINGRFYAMVQSTCGSCPAGWTATDGVCVAQQPAACSAGNVKHSGTLYQSGAISGGGYCSGGCAVQPSGGNLGAVCVELANGVTSCAVGNNSTSWVATGTACTEPASPALAPVVTTATGETYQLQPNGCGLVNGEPFCASDTPPNPGCVTTPGGQAFCTSGTPAPPAPSAPGQPGVPATPSSTLTTTVNNTTVTVNHYNTTVVGQSTGGGTGGTPGGTTGGTGGGNGGNTGGGIGGTTGGECGGVGEPKCGVRIDETGTPDGVPDEFGRVIDPDQLGEYQTQADTSLADVGQGVSTMFAGIADNIDRATSFSTECTSVSYEVRGVARDVPGTRGCQLLDGFKRFASWILGILVALSIFVTVKESIR